MGEERRRSVDDMPEASAADVTVHRRRVKELRVVEGTEDFDPELERPLLRQMEPFLQCRVKILDPRSAEIAAARIPMVPSAGTRNSPVLNAAWLVRGLKWMSGEPAATSGESSPLLLIPFGIDPSSNVSLLLWSVTGRPVPNRVMPESDYPDAPGLPRPTSRSKGTLYW